MRIENDIPRGQLPARLLSVLVVLGGTGGIAAAAELPKAKAAASQVASQSPRALVETICPLMEQHAEIHDIPPVLFLRLIWRESRFQPGAVSPKGAQGIAQFMPATAKERGLADPFDPQSAIPHSARLLADLKRQLGNIGLATAAYNAGPERVRGWLLGRRTLPGETAAYVRFITGQPAEHWKGAEPALPQEIAVKPDSLQDACRKLAPRIVHAVKHGPSRAAQSQSRPWGVQLGAGFTRANVEAIYQRLRKRHGKLLSESDPMFVQERNLSRGRRALVALRIGAETRDGAQSLCLKLRADGAACTVRKN